MLEQATAQAAATTHWAIKCLAICGGSAAFTHGASLLVSGWRKRPSVRALVARDVILLVCAVAVGAWAGHSWQPWDSGAFWGAASAGVGAVNRSFGRQVVAALGRVVKSVLGRFGAGGES